MHLLNTHGRVERVNMGLSGPLTESNVMLMIFEVHGSGLTPAETEKSIDLHKVSRGSGLTILRNSNPELERK